MTEKMTGAHKWRFFRSGGFDQVRIETVDDLRALDQLDLKLWASLACPVKGLEFDERTLSYIDQDGDGRIRAPEILAAVRWTLDNLADPSVMFNHQELPLAAIDQSHESGAKIYRAAAHVVHNLGRADNSAISVEDTNDLAKIFPPEQANGDGIVPVALTANETVKALIQDIIDALGAEKDRSGEDGISQEKADEFFTQAEALQVWRDRLAQEPSLSEPFGDNADAAIAAYQAVANKVEDFFMRSQFAAYDARAATLMNGSEADLTQLSAQALHAGTEEAIRLPLAQVTAEGELPLVKGVNPAWVGAISAFRDQVVTPLMGEHATLSFSEWQSIQGTFSAYLNWQADKPAVHIDAIDADKLKGYLANNVKADLDALIAQDKSVEEAAASTLDADKLIRFQRFLVPLLNNFVALRDFYAGNKAIFQNGTLYLDGRSFDLCVQVNDATKHSALASFSRTYLVYADCARKGSTEKMTIVAAVTAGNAGNLLAGRNGVFYDRKGQDWDATITKLVENPISLREAFWSPYRRIGRLISEQAQKMAASKEQAMNDKAASGVTGAATKIEAAPAAGATAPAAAPVPFDIGKFVGIFAAIGLALGAIGTALAAVITGFLSLPWWQIPLALIGVLLLVSGPSVILAWFKLRDRNLAPILDANGWAVNTEAKINIPFGTALTHLATLPQGSQRSLVDPYAEKRSPWWWLLVLAVLVGAGYYGYKSNWFMPKPEVVEAPVDAAPAPATDAPAA